ncbi:MAG: aminotransferase class V-fold PLP-dependent enzyme, partial [Alphaproteobacteria bacterium]
CNASPEYAVIFTGSGATSGVNRLVHLLLPPSNAGAAQPLVLLGPYEHHSNILPWRESGAEVMEIPEAGPGGIDLAALETALREQVATRRKIIGAFSAASNVTGVIADVSATTALLKRYGALAIWDFAGGGPYLGIDAQVGDGADAIVLSPHKFVGGPAASGVLIVRKDAVLATKPTLPGGGTVAFVSPWAHRYLDDVVAREEAGTPNVIGDIRVALAFLVKEAVGTTFIMERCAKLRRRALDVWRQEDRIDLLGPRDAAALPILSFRIKDGAGGFVHHQLVTRLLSDHFGVQARGGCACAAGLSGRRAGAGPFRARSRPAAGAGRNDPE